jgi:hypothetical protein
MATRKEFHKDVSPANRNGFVADVRLVCPWAMYTGIVADSSSIRAIPVLLLLGGPGRKWSVFGEGMGISETELKEAVAQSVTSSDEALIVDLADGRTITVPLAWFPRLAHGTLAERANWRFIGGGVDIHWPDLDEDISVESLLAGRKSGEAHASLRRWLQARKAG